MTTLAKEHRALRARLEDLDRDRAKLTAELTALETERGRVEYALEILERVDPGTQPASGQFRRLQTTGRRIEGSAADYAIRALTSLGTSASADEVVEEMKRLGWDAQVSRPIESARVALIRGIETGEVEKSGYGRYRIIPKPNAFGVVHPASMSQVDPREVLR